MKNNDKTREQLLKELEKSNRRIAELEKSETEPNQADEELRLHTAIIDNVAEGIYLIGLDDLIIKWTNEKFERMFGYDPGEIVGKQVDIVNAPTERTPAETRISIVDVLKETGEWHGEVRNIKRDGTHFWCYANVSLFDHPEYGKVIVSVHTDITERKQAKEEVRKLSKVVETTPEAVVITDMQGTIEYVNQGLLTLGGFKNNNLIIGKPVFMFSNKEGVKQLQEEIIPTILSEGKWRGEVPVKRKDDSIFPADMVCSLILDEEGKPKYLLSQYHDITKRKKAEEELRKKMNELEAFYRTTLGREGRVIELKQEVNELLEQLGKKKKYANN